MEDPTINKMQLLIDDAQHRSAEYRRQLADDPPSLRDHNVEGKATYYEGFTDGLKRALSVYEGKG